MADDHGGAGGGGPVEDALFVLGILVALVVLWFATGNPSRADVRGIFLHPPKPVGQGGAYGPTPDSGTSTGSSIPVHFGN